MASVVMWRRGRRSETASFDPRGARAKKKVWQSNRRSAIQAPGSLCSWTSAFALLALRTPHRLARISSSLRLTRSARPLVMAAQGALAMQAALQIILSAVQGLPAGITDVDVDALSSRLTDFAGDLVPYASALGGAKQAQLSSNVTFIAQNLESLTEVVERFPKDVRAYSDNNALSRMIGFAAPGSQCERSHW